MDTAASRKPFLIRSEHMHIDEFGAAFSRMFGNRYAGLPPPGRTLAIAGVYGRYEGVSFRQLRFRGDLLTQMPDLDDEISFMFPTAGRVVIDQGGETVGAASTGLAIEKASLRSLGFIDNHAQYGLSVRRELFTRRLAQLLERPIMQQVQFASQVNLRAGAFQGIKAVVGLATGDEFDCLLRSGVLMPDRLQEMLVDAVLEAWPHTYSEALRRPAPKIAPRHVKLAVDYIQAHPDALLSGSELARLANVSQRALQEGFRRFVGLSIVAYQRQVRLQRAHEALRQDRSRSVREVALELGFTHVGRFGQYFQQAYGMSPAEWRGGSKGR